MSKISSPKAQNQAILQNQEVLIDVGDESLPGILAVPNAAAGIILFAHGSGSSRLSPRNQYVARQFNQAGLATLLFDLLTSPEERLDRLTGQLRFNVGLLANRLSAVADWVSHYPETQQFQIGYFGASTGAAAALMAAAHNPHTVKAIVSRGGRPDLGGDSLRDVQAPSLLMVGSLDTDVIGLNEQAFQEMRCEKKLQIIPGASHLFEEPGKLETVSEIATTWFLNHLIKDNL
ncbi:dienelactone hydrolase family protein [Vampirovibrio sp.]|uniref:dienelactone hydrolase family protein n=1 Tax=Vampirovibrio sp. TaxID=2717857 RepID=UPI003594718A